MRWESQLNISSAFHHQGSYTSHPYVQVAKFVFHVNVTLVGRNGAGKTTLIKLLTRLYDPSEGQILLDGVDLRRRIGVIFHDFIFTT